MSEDVSTKQAVEAIEVAAALGMEITAPAGTVAWLAVYTWDKTEYYARLFLSQEAAEAWKAERIQDAKDNPEDEDLAFGLTGDDEDDDDELDKMVEITKIIVGGELVPIN